MKIFNKVGSFLSNLLDTKLYAINDEHLSLSDICLQLELRILSLNERIEKLEEENTETTNTLYELMHSIDALDSRIDIVAEHNETQKNQMGCSEFGYDINGPHNF